MAVEEHSARGNRQRRASPLTKASGGTQPLFARSSSLSPSKTPGTPPAPTISAVALDLLRAGHPVRFTARGRSMRPFIRDGDVLTVEPTARLRVCPGDVLFYSRPEGAAAHRLLGFRVEGGRRVALLRGDQTGLWTETVEWTAVAGVVVAAHRGGRRVYRRSVADRVAGLTWAYGHGLQMKARIVGSRLKRACLHPDGLRE